MGEQTYKDFIAEWISLLPCLGAELLAYRNFKEACVLKEWKLMGGPLPHCHSSCAPSTCDLEIGMTKSENT